MDEIHEQPEALRRAFNAERAHLHDFKKFAAARDFGTATWDWKRSGQPRTRRQQIPAYALSL